MKYKFTIIWILFITSISLFICNVHVDRQNKYEHYKTYITEVENKYKELTLTVVSFYQDSILYKELDAFYVAVPYTAKLISQYNDTVYINFNFFEGTKIELTNMEGNSIIGKTFKYKDQPYKSLLEIGIVNDVEEAPDDSLNFKVTMFFLLLVGGGGVILIFLTEKKDNESNVRLPCGD